jgi:organic radical activating enzyme
MMIRKKKINSVSQSFCIAKWKQVTIDLFNAQTHSCHHPRRHHIPQEEIEENPSALHNTINKKEQRAKMLKGERPYQCEYCWNIEDTDKDLYSDRHLKSFSDWAFPYIDEIAKADPFDNTAPSYVEIMFDNTCNFACSYCQSSISSSIYNEVKKFGPLKLQKSFNVEHRASPFVDEEFNKKIGRHIDREKYVEAFWKWFPTIAETLHTFRVTGGEPMLTPNTKKVLEYIKDNPNPNLTFALNTNLGVRENTFQDYLVLLKELLTDRKIGHLQIFTSFDAVGDRANYIRPGMDIDLVIKRMKIINKEVPNTFLIIMSTFSILSIPSLYELVELSVELKKEGIDHKLDISYVKEPFYLKANLVDEELFEIFEEQYLKVEKDFFPTEYMNDEEIEKIKRIFFWVKSSYKDNKEKFHRLEFVRFIDQFDERKGFNFEKTFPEFMNFYNKNKKAIKLFAVNASSNDNNEKAEDSDNG